MKAGSFAFHVCRSRYKISFRLVKEYVCRIMWCQLGASTIGVIWRKRLSERVCYVHCVDAIPVRPNACMYLISMREVSGSKLPNWRSGTLPPRRIISGLPFMYYPCRC